MEMAVSEDDKSSSWRDFLTLSKPTITLLVVVTTLPGLLFSQSTLPSWPLMVATLMGTACVSASAAVFNQLMEVSIDYSMDRTRKRSLPSGRVKRMYAMIFGVCLGFAGLTLLYVFVSALSAVIAACGHLFYVIVYTGYLKQRTPQNIVIGGAAGAVGPLIGYAACGTLSWGMWALFLVITLWTPPHFWALALHYKKDYARVGVPMYPVVYGDDETRRVMLLYTLALVPLMGLLFYFRVGGIVSLTINSLATARFVWLAYKLWRQQTNDSAMPLFHYSCVYTLIIFTVLSCERMIMLMLEV